MPRDHRFKQRVRSRMAATGETYTAARAALNDEFGYFPRHGWRRSARGHELASLVSAEHGAARLEVTRALVTSERTDVSLRITNLPSRPRSLDSPRRPGLLVRVPPGDWETPLAMAHGGGPTGAEIDAQFAGHSGRPRRLELRLDGDYGDWEVAVDLVPAVALRSVASTATAVKHGGVTLEPIEVVRTGDLLVVRVTATAEHPVALVRALGTDNPVRMPNEYLTLVDEHGRQFHEVKDPNPSRFNDGRHHAIVFGPIPPDARTFELAVPSVTGVERTDDVEVDLPPAEGELQLGRHRLRLLGWRRSEGRLADFYPVTIDLKGGTTGDATLIRPEQILVNGRGVAMSFPTTGGTSIAIQSQEEPPFRLGLRHALVRIPGPWMLRFST